MVKSFVCCYNLPTWVSQKFLLGGLPQCFLLFVAVQAEGCQIECQRRNILSNWRCNWYRKQLEDRRKDKLSMGGNRAALAQKLKLDYRCQGIHGGDVDLDWVCTQVDATEVTGWLGIHRVAWTISSATILDHQWWSEKNDRFIISSSSSSSLTEFLLAMLSTSCISRGSKRGHADRIEGIAGRLDPLNLCTNTGHNHPTYTTPHSKIISTSVNKHLNSQHAMHATHSQLLHSTKHRVNAAGQKSRSKSNSSIAQRNCWQKELYL